MRLEGTERPHLGIFHSRLPGEAFIDSSSSAPVTSCLLCCLDPWNVVSWNVSSAIVCQDTVHLHVAAVVEQTIPITVCLFQCEKKNRFWPGPFFQVHSLLLLCNSNLHFYSFFTLFKDNLTTWNTLIRTYCALNNMEKTEPSPVLLDTLPLVEETTKRRKRGILGAPVGDTPMLFSFTSKELWPDNGKDDDSDEDYTPESSRKSPSNKRSKRSQPAKQLAIASTSSSTDVGGDSSTTPSLSTSTSQMDEYPSISSPSSFSSEQSASSLDSSKGKGGKRARKSPNAKSSKAKAKPKARSKIYTTRAKVVYS